jgi:hypothetical protein
MAMGNVAEDDDIGDIAAQWVLRQDRGALSPQECSTATDITIR